MRNTLLLALSGGLLSLTAAQGQEGITIWIDEDVPILPLQTDHVVHSAEELFNQSCPEEVSRYNSYHPQLLRTSYDTVHNASFENGEVFFSSSSFIRGAVEAWGQHQHLFLRPDEVWFEILTQLNAYMFKNAEKVRDIFVNHQGQENIRVAVWNDESAVDNLVTGFAYELRHRVKTPWLADWVKPGFSTTTPEDELTANVLMMGLLQQFFSYTGVLLCGLPSVTLLGTREDWEALSGKLEHLKDFGEEPTQYAEVLRPIMDGFLRSWDEPDSETTKDFWSKIVLGGKNYLCSGQTLVSGWITGFSFWNKSGNLILTAAQRQNAERGTQLGNVKYVSRDVNLLPVSYAKVPVRMAKHPRLPPDSDVYLLAGNIGVHRTASPEGVFAEPLSGWYMYGPVDTQFEIRENSGNGEELRGISRSIDQCSLPALAS
ncbi:hypothetical protein XA68_16272 [Ophiocordyceps unilateralis]|uniref:DUF4419 domain-containing protein n=1 Tax=Ophiocordyceps unilateralis TaxID=268505 RepID=A0A2A9P6V4_OPHUN|nr:hypothetical protein XA68_16272 [Ophiocordyceps unilateralis]